MFESYATSGPPTLFVTGSGKNAGKTVALKRLLGAFRAAGRGRLGLLSIGDDGEAVDAFDGREKPSIGVSAGELVCTGAGCLSRAGALLSVEHLFPFTRGGGDPVVLARVVRSGNVELVGPDTAAQAAEAVRALQAAGAERVAADGAIDRLAHTGLCDGAGMVYVASTKDYASAEALETALVHLARVFNGIPPARGPAWERVPPGSCGIRSAAGLSLFGSDEEGRLVAALTGMPAGGTLIVNLPATGRLVDRLLPHIGRTARLVFATPALVRCGPARLAAIEAAGVRLAVGRPVRLVGVGLSHVEARRPGPGPRGLLERLARRLSPLPVGNALLACKGGSVGAA